MNDFEDSGSGTEGDVSSNEDDNEPESYPINAGKGLSQTFFSVDSKLLKRTTPRILKIPK